MENIEEVNIKKFKMDDIDLNAKIAIIGKPGTGKSSIIKDVLWHHRDRFLKGFIMSGTTESSGDFTGLIPDIFTYGGYDEKVASTFWKKQKQTVGKRGKQNPNNQAFMVIDDCMHDTSWVRSKTVADIFMNGRHYDILFIVAMQYCMGILPGLRTCLDYVFICRENSFSNKKKLFEHYCSVFPDFKMFCKVLDALTVDYQCIVVKQRKNTSTRIDENIFWYKAELHPKFKVGSLAMWEYENMKLNTQYKFQETMSSDTTGTKKTKQGRRAVVDTNKRQKPGTLVINMQD